jgi:hypothetical protein
VDGSGLEIRDVYYKGKLVLRQGSLPVLNVLYDAPYQGCGSEDGRSYRDWQRELAVFDADGVRSDGYAESTTTPKTACDNPGASEDPGHFSGVAVENRDDSLTLMTVMQAGWYRYIQSWVFFPDGKFKAQLGFSAVKAPCITKSHTHDAYWRFDFTGFGTKLLERGSGATETWAPLDTEAKRLKVPKITKWKILGAGNNGYELIPSEKDGSADDWAGGDFWALRPHPNEIDDGGACRGCGPKGNAEHLDQYVNGEPLDSGIVVWYRAGYRHTLGPTCEMVGPTFAPTQEH